MNDLANITQTINARYNMMLLSVDRARDEMGLEEEVLNYNETEQGNSRRSLLRVEKLALRDKELNRKHEQASINSVRDLVHESLYDRFKQRLADNDNLLNKVLGFDQNLPELLDVLSIRATSISKITPTASNVPWLFEELLKIVNMPKYRRVDAKGKLVTVDTMRGALGFVGIDNLKMLIPSLAFRRWIPQITDPFPTIKTRVWEEALAVAISAKKIAEVSDVEANHAFILGMFHDIGRIVTVRLYFSLFEAVQREALIEAHDNKQREEHAYLTKIAPSATFLNKLINEFAFSISSKLIEMMQMRRVFIANAMQEFSEPVSLAEASPLAKVLLQARGYAQYRMLKGHKLISLDESKAFLQPLNFPAGALSSLKTTDLRQLNLALDEDE